MGGAHIGGVIVVDGARPVRDVLVPVYEALGLEWDPAVTGSVADEVPGIGMDQVERALLDELSADRDWSRRRSTARRSPSPSSWSQGTVRTLE